MDQSKNSMDASDSLQPELPHSPFSPGLVPRSSTNDDRHVMAKHSAICPHSKELKAVWSFVNTTKDALMMVTNGKKSCGFEEPLFINASCMNTEAESDRAEGLSSQQSFKVMRTGPMAKRLLLHGDTHLDLVLICKDRPTRSLLVSISITLQRHLKVAAQGKGKFEVKANPDDAVIEVAALHSKLTMNITLTSPAIQQYVENKDADMTPLPTDVLDERKCLNALAAIRHIKWFQAQIVPQESCVIVLRVMRDLCNRAYTWKPLQGWVIELICEKAIMSSVHPMGAGEAFRRVIECLAAGMLLEDKPGILDPCEKEPKDVLDGINAQQKEDITRSAQYAMRLVAFGQLHLVLGINEMSNIKEVMKRKRRRKPRPNDAFAQLMQIRSFLRFRFLPMSGTRHSRIFTMTVDLDGVAHEASGPSQKTARCNLALKVLQVLRHSTGVETKQVEKESKPDWAVRVIAAGANSRKTPASSSAPLAAASVPATLPEVLQVLTHSTGVETKQVEEESKPDEAICVITAGANSSKTPASSSAPLAAASVPATLPEHKAKTPSWSSTRNGVDLSTRLPQKKVPVTTRDVGIGSIEVSVHSPHLQLHPQEATQPQL
uniref:interleukin enhancer-binding factor 3-like isoform X2 n=1 Tax=Myxine glutinosa TaxID=7769 RepID=UPI00358F5F16